MGSRFTRTKALVAAGAIALASGAVVLGTALPGGASSPSDVRADFNSGNAVDCGDVGFGEATTAFANGDDDINVDGIVGTASGTTANIATPLPDDIVIVAVVMKGGPAYNVYTADSGDGLANYTPLGVEAENTDGLPSPQNYISPLNNGGNIPAISHWFICYTGGETPPPPNPEPGTLRVQKIVVNPNGLTLQAQYFVNVVCDDGTTADNLALPADGTFVTVSDDIEANSFCTVTEVTPGVPVNTTGTVVVTYNPPTAPAEGTNDGVQVPEDGTVDVTVTNNYSDVLPQVQAVSVTPAFTG